MPSTPYDAKGLLISSIEDPDPVIFMEPKRIYRAGKQEVPEEMYRIPIGKAKVVKEGKDVTVVAWGPFIREVQKAMKLLEEKGHSVERKEIRMPEGSIKSIGEYQINIHLGIDTEATVNLIVEPNK